MFQILKNKKADKETINNIKLLQELKLNVHKMKQYYSKLDRSDISDCTRDICKTADLILKEVSLNQDKLSRVKLFIEHYVPTVTKMFQQYIEIQNNRLTGERSIQTKQTIEVLLPKIKDAFTELLNQLFNEEHRDVDTAIKVLMYELSQKGLLDE